jgi:hypothetical protein
MGCGQGAVEVVLTAPSAESARPVGATQVALRAVASDGEVITRSAAIVDGAFDLGELPIADYLGMTVELRDDVGGQVGFGRSTASTATPTPWPASPSPTSARRSSIWPAPATVAGWRPRPRRAWRWSRSRRGPDRPAASSARSPR